MGLQFARAGERQKELAVAHGHRGQPLAHHAATGDGVGDRCGRQWRAGLAMYRPAANALASLIGIGGRPDSAADSAVGRNHAVVRGGRFDGSGPWSRACCPPGVPRASTRQPICRNIGGASPRRRGAGWRGALSVWRFRSRFRWCWCRLPACSPSACNNCGASIPACAANARLVVDVDGERRRLQRRQPGSAQRASAGPARGPPGGSGRELFAGWNLLGP